MSNPRQQTQTTGHRYALQRLSAYMDGQLSEREQARVESHLMACPDCREELRTLRWTQDLARQMPVMPVPRSFIVREADLKVTRIALPQFHLAPILAGLQTAAAVFAVLLVLVFAGDLWLGRGLPAGQSPPMLSMQAQVTETAMIELADRPTSAQSSTASTETDPPPDAPRIMAQKVSTTTAAPELAPLDEAEPTNSPGAEPSPSLLPRAAQTPTAAGFSSEVTSTKSMPTPKATVTSAPTYTPAPEPTAPPEPTATAEPTQTPAPPPTFTPTSEPDRVAAVPEQATLERAETEKRGSGEGQDASYGFLERNSRWRVAQIGLGVVLLGLLIAIAWLRRWGRFG